MYERSTWTLGHLEHTGIRVVTSGMTQLASSPINNKLKSAKNANFDLVCADVAIIHSSGSPLTMKLVPTCPTNATQVRMIQEVWMDVSWCEAIISHVRSDWLIRSTEACREDCNTWNTNYEAKYVRKPTHECPLFTLHVPLCMSS